MNMSITWAAFYQNIIYVPLVIVAGAILLYRAYRWAYATRMLSSIQQKKIVLSSASFMRYSTKSVLLFIALCFVMLALLRPQWNKKEVIVHQQGRDVLVALDISRSMLAQDCKPNRLECAKEKIKTLLGMLSCERVGLIVFSGSSFVQCPLTTDYAAFYMFLKHIDVETISSGTTALDKAIEQALYTFNDGKKRRTKLLVILTDGEDFSSSLNSVKQEAAQAGITIVTLGIGSAQGSPIPLYNEQGKQVGHQLDKKGSVVISRLNDGILRTLAQDCNGMYIPLHEGDDDVQAIANYVASFQKEALDDARFTHYEEQYPYFVAIGLICCMVEWLL